MSDDVTPPVETPPVTTPPVVETPPVETPPVETPPADGTPPVEETPPAVVPPADEEPPVRKTRAEYIKDRQDAKAVKDAAKADDSKIDPDDLAIVDRVIQEKYGERFAQMDADAAVIEDQKLTGEISEFVKANPQFVGHEAKIKTYAKHAAYNKLPVEQVAYAAVGKSLLKVGADIARAADKEAAESGAGGGSIRASDSGAKDYANMPAAEMEAEIAKAKGHI